MFSQRNNPYCDLLHFSLTKLLNNKYLEVFILLKYQKGKIKNDKKQTAGSLVLRLYDGFVFRTGEI